MKKILLTLAGFIVTFLSIAQSPNLMNYQGVARNATGNVLPNQSISLRLSILSGGPAGASVYSETRTLLTNAFGLFNVVVGSAGATNVVGTIAGINWTAFGAGSGTKFLMVEIDPVGGANFVNVGSTQLVSVPYALNAGSAAPVGPAGGDLTGTYPNPQILIPLIKTQSVPGNPLIGMTNSSTTGVLGALQGTSASTDANAVAVQGTLSSTAPGAGSAAVKGVNNGTGVNGTGVAGSQAGGGIGVSGTAPNGIGVSGISTSGTGVSAISATGIAVNGISNSSNAGAFQNTNAANTAVTVAVTTNGVGDGVSSIATGTGRGGLFQVNNAASTANAIEAFSNGTGASWGIRANATGTQGAGLFVQSNATNTSNNLQSNQAGLGRAGLFQATNTATNADAVFASTVSTGTTSSALHGTAGLSGITVVAKKGAWGESDGGVGVFGTSSTLNGVMGTTNTGPAGVAGFAFGTGVGVTGSSLVGSAADFNLPTGNASRVMNVTTAGTGTGADISNTNAANLSNVILATNANANAGATSPLTGGGAALFARKGGALGTFVTNPTASYAVAADPAAGQSISALGLTNAGLGVVGLNLTTGTAVLGQSVGTGTAVFAVNTSTGYGLVTAGRVQIQGQGAGINRVLTSDNVGNATWNTLASVGGVSGTGTLDFIPKWTPNGTTIGNSQLFDNGTNIGLGTTSPNARLDIPNASAGTRGAQITNSVATNNSSAVFAQTNNITSTSFFEGSAVTGVMPLNVATTMLSGASTIKGIASTNAAISQFSGIGVQGASAAGFGVVGNTNSGIALAGIGWGTGYGLYTFGKVQIEGQGAALNRILRSDANGNATWETLGSVGGVSGSGTLNTITKWSPDGNTISNSLLFDDGTNVGVGNITPSYRLDVQHGGATGIRSRSSGTFSVIDIDAANGDAALRFQAAGVNQWNTRNRPADNYYEIFELGGGGSRFVIQDGSGNVGIGETTNPSYKLDVLHGGATGIRSRSNATFSVIDIDANNGDAALRFAKAGVNQWNIRNRPADDYFEIFELGGGGSRMVIQDGSGNVGIGETTAPAYKLDVLHGGATGIRSRSSGTFSVIDIDASNGDAALRFQAAGVNQWNTRNRPADNYYEIFELGGGGSRVVIQDGSGNVGIGETTAPSYKLDVLHGGATGIRSRSSGTFSVIDIDASNGDAALRFQAAGVNQWNTRNRPADNYYEIFELGGGGSRFVIQDGSGNVGIGESANPTYKLDVLHGGATGIRSRSSGTFSLMDIDAANGDAALRFAKAGVNQWNIRNNPANDDLQIFELGGGGERMRIENTTGNVVVNGNLSKGGGSFKIDHPLDPANKYLYHSFVESPDMMNIYNGNITTDATGKATVKLPDYFEALNMEFRYQLTVIGAFAQAIVNKEVSGNQFEIATNQPNVKVSWQVTGVRHDAYANQNRIPTEVEKAPQDKGKYLHPKAFNLTQTKAISYDATISSLSDVKAEPEKAPNALNTTGGSLEQQAITKPNTGKMDNNGSVSDAAPAKTAAKTLELTGSVLDAPAAKPSDKKLELNGSVLDVAPQKAMVKPVVATKPVVTTAAPTAPSRLVSTSATKDDMPPAVIPQKPATTTATGNTKPVSEANADKTIPGTLVPAPAINISTGSAVQSTVVPANTGKMPEQKISQDVPKAEPEVAPSVPPTAPKAPAATKKGSN